MNQQVENLGFKATSVAGIVLTIIMGLSSMMAMHAAGIKSANEYTDKEINISKEYTDYKVDPLEREFHEFKEETKKKLNELPRK